MFQKLKRLLQSLRLLKRNKEPAALVKGADLKIEDLTKELLVRVSPNASQALSIKVFNLINRTQEFNRKYALVKMLYNLKFKTANETLVELSNGSTYSKVDYFGIKVTDRSKIDPALDAMATVLTDLGNRGFIDGSLLVAGLLEFTDGTFALLSYPSITSAGQLYLQANPVKMAIKEGQAPLYAV
jgi:hypothetical protein